MTKSMKRAQSLLLDEACPDALTTAVVSVSESDLEALEERAAIMEYDGGLSQREAKPSAKALAGLRTALDDAVVAFGDTPMLWLWPAKTAQRPSRRGERRSPELSSHALRNSQ